MRRWLSILALGLAGPALAADHVPGLAPMAFLAGHCFEGEIRPEQRDRHCYAWTAGGHVLRDRHRIIGEGQDYSGETLYRVDESGTLRFVYLASNGGWSEGEAHPDEDGIRFPDESWEMDGERRVFRTLWTELSDAGYTSRTEERVDDTWVEAWSVRYDKITPPRADLFLGWAESDDRIVFTSTRAGSYDVYAMRPDGGGLRRLVDAPGTEWVYAGGDHAWGVSDAFGEGYRLIRLDPFADDPGFEPFSELRVADSAIAPLADGRVVVASKVDGANQLFLLAADGSVERQLTQGPHAHSDPTVAADGRLVMRSDRSGRWELWLGHLDGREPEQLTDYSFNDDVRYHYGGEGPAAFSPDGRQLLWHSLRRGDVNLYLMDLESREIRELTGPGWDQYYASWSPDGKVLYSEQGLGNLRLRALDPESGEKIALSLTEDGWDYAPVWVRRER